MGKLTISMAMFNSYVKLPEGTLWLFNIAMERSTHFIARYGFHGYVK